MAKAPKPVLTEGQKAVEAAKTYLAKQFGTGALMDLTGAVELHNCIHTGHPFVDYVFGGGVPYGKMVEIYGPPSSGKTTLCMMTVIEAQKKANRTGRVWWGDYEHSFDLEYYKKLGGSIDPDKLLVSQPTTAEEGFEIARVMINRGLVDAIVFDSVAAMMSFKESGGFVDGKGIIVEDGTKGAKKQGEMGSTQIGLHARVITQGIKQLNALIGQHDVACMFINQTRTKIATGPGQRTTETTTGGNAIKFYSSVRLELQRVKSKKGKLYDPIENKILDDQVVAIETRVKGAKNKVAPPFRQAICTVTFGQGFDVESDLLRMACAHKIVTKGKTGWYSTQDIGASRNARGEADFRKLLKEEPPIREALMTRVQDLLSTLSEQGMTVVDEDERELAQADAQADIVPNFGANAVIDVPSTEIKPPAGPVSPPKEVVAEDKDISALLSDDPEPDSLSDDEIHAKAVAFVENTKDSVVGDSSNPAISVVQNLPVPG